ncbi:hypothetical protein [Carnobacterium maltaromaticum]|uniref:hypothetical protein n=1 Tax=Carnobacterium maltaromaticum TaxID=2751 RepID=UPI000E76E77E|nr:hypothetical protein [Carnobacterium maltaromaticum]AOA04111.1 hypothetical protein BFC23_16460 [Carnobacterium maltaromaticum]MCC4313420.1 hypothetical protein [Carnobacterium maltaromaticum]
MRQNHKMGDYLYKNGNVYKIVPHWDDLFTYGGLVSLFLQESTGKMFRSPYLIEKDDFSYMSATTEQIEKFDLVEKDYQKL